MNCMPDFMNNAIQDRYELEAAISLLDHTAHGCRLQIADIRRSMDASCDRGIISLHQWRCMMEVLGAIQGQCAAVDINEGWNLLQPPAQSAHSKE